MSTNRYLPLFVYGTLRSDAPGTAVLPKNAIIEQAPAYLKDASMYIGAAYPLAIRSLGGTGVHGEILLINEALFEQVLAELDDYEGYLGEGRTDNLYVRSTAQVEVFAGPDTTWEGATQNIPCYVYLASPEAIQENRAELCLSPSGDWNNRESEWAQYQESLEELNVLAEEDDDRFPVNEPDPFDEDYVDSYHYLDNPDHLDDYQEE